ncbi:hypothetical protein ACN5J0_15835 [Vibrio cholerae]|uniref:hypothetical protein n=1 Tax=Vibrio cholerae TaxID=666 RepID=UPI003AF844FF
MQKYLITSTIALTLFGCGGGGSSNPPAPLVKYFNIDFFDLSNVSDESNCQIFAYNNDQTRKVIAYRSTPADNYAIVIHDVNGQFVKSYTNQEITKASFRFPQDEVPDNGYISFGEFSNSGTLHISTFEKSLLPESFAIYAKNKHANTACLTTSTNNSNPQEVEYTAFIKPPTDDNFFFFNLNHYNQSSFNPANKDGVSVIVKATRHKPLLLTAYERSNTTPDAIKNLFAFKFEQTRGLGSTNTIGSPNIQERKELDEITTKDNQWNPPANVTLSSAQLFVDGRQYQAPYAYLWQPLTTDSNGGSYSYTEKIKTENYYLNLQGQQPELNQQPSWSFNIVAQADEDIASNLTPMNILDQYPNAEQPEITSCQQDSNAQCIQVVDTSSVNELIQRIFVYRSLENAPSIFVRQVFYTLSKTEIPVMKFNKDYIDGGFSSTTLGASISLLHTKSRSVIDAFLYQHQDLSNITSADQLTNAQVDYIPLLKNLTAQQDQQDLLKRQTYTWLKLVEDNR